MTPFIFLSVLLLLIVAYITMMLVQRRTECIKCGKKLWCTVRYSTPGGPNDLGIMVTVKRYHCRCGYNHYEADGNVVIH